MSEDKNIEKREEVVINLDKLGVPIAIIIAGLVIALGIFLASRNSTNNNTNNSNTNTNNTNTDTSDDDSTNDDLVITNMDDDPYLGNKETAKVAIVEFSDYECSYCQKFAEETLPSIIKDYIDTGKIVYVYRDFPLSFHGEIAQTAAEAGECVHELAGNDVFSKFHKQAYLVASESNIYTIAKGLGVDETALRSCVSADKYKEEVNKDLSDGQEAGVTGTPGFIIGVIGSDGKVEGKMIAGAYPYATFQTAIEEMLAK